MKNKVSDKIRVKRIPDRGHYDQKTVHDILDASFLCHVAIGMEKHPVVIPMAYGRKDHFIYLHGATKSRLIQFLEAGNECSIAVTLVDSLVLARSVFHHSMNYRSVVLFGKAEKVIDLEEKIAGLEAITNHILPGRWEEARLPNEIELKATTVLKISLEQSSAKIRTGMPKDEKDDMNSEYWAGILPILTTFGKPESDPELRSGIGIPSSLQKLS